MDTLKQSAMSVAIAAALMAALWFSAGRADAQQADIQIASKGELRAALQIFNPLLVTRSPEGEFSGVSVDLGNALGKKLGMPVKWVPYDNIARYNQSFGKDEWDVAFSARDLSRTGQLAFSDAFMEVDHSYVVKPGSVLRSPDEVDRPGVIIAVAQGSAADSYLTRTLRSAQIVRLYGGLVTAKDTLSLGRADAYADYTYLVYRVAAEVPGATVLASRFNLLRMAIALPKVKAALLPVVNEFLKESKRDGVVNEFVKRAGWRGVRSGR
jgi:polar amino acid transport system substrate-binding protein